MTDYQAATLITKTVAAIAGLEPMEMGKLTQEFRISHPRQVVMALIHKHTRLGTKRVAEIFGLGHANVIHAQKKIRKAKKGDFQKEIYEEAERQLETKL